MTIEYETIKEDFISDPNNSETSQRDTTKLQTGTTHPCQLIIESVSVDKNAVIFHFSDHSGFIQVLRDMICRASKHEKLRALEDELKLKEGSLVDCMSIPDIIHSTFIRYASCQFKSNKEEEEFTMELKEIVSTWQPIPIHITSFHLVYEYNPYMQMSKSGTINPIIASYQLSTDTSGSSGGKSKGPRSNTKEKPNTVTLKTATTTATYATVGGAKHPRNSPGEASERIKPPSSTISTSTDVSSSTTASKLKTKNRNGNNPVLIHRGLVWHRKVI